MRGDDRLQQIAPIRRASLIVGIDFGQVAIATYLFEPEFELGLIGIETDCRSGIRATNAGLSDFQPATARQILGANQTECWTVNILRRNTCRLRHIHGLALCLHDKNSWTNRRTPRSAISRQGVVLVESMKLESSRLPRCHLKRQVPTRRYRPFA